jgi:hypothetical protein
MSRAKRVRRTSGDDDKVGDLSSVGQGHAVADVALALFWLGGPHVCAFNAPAEHREGWFGLANQSRVCSRVVTSVSSTLWLVIS